MGLIREDERALDRKRQRMFCYIVVIIFLSIMMGVMVGGIDSDDKNTAPFPYGEKYQSSDYIERQRNMIEQVTVADRTIVLFRTCFPDNHFRADAAPLCKAFRDLIVREADKSQEEFDHDGKE